MRSICIAVVVAVFGAAQSWAQVALTPSTPVITSSPALVPSSPALAATPPGFVATNASLVALADALVLLQTNLQQTLPVLTLFNDNFDFVSLGDNGQAASASAAAPGNFSANFGTNFAANFGVSAGVPVGPSLFNTAQNRTTSSAAGLPQGFATVPMTRDSLRALLVLQSDMQRMLPLLNALNNGSAASPGSFTNLFGFVPARP